MIVGFSSAAALYWRGTRMQDDQSKTASKTVAVLPLSLRSHALLPRGGPECRTTHPKRRNALARLDFRQRHCRRARPDDRHDPPDQTVRDDRRPTTATPSPLPALPSASAPHRSCQSAGPVCGSCLVTKNPAAGARCRGNWATDRGGAIAPLDDAGAATGALMPTICVVPRLERNQGGSAQRGLDGSTEATLVCPVTHHCGGSGGRRGTPLMHLQLPHHMNDADVTDVHICTGSYSTRY